MFCVKYIELIDDEDIVRAAISQGGLELQYASRRLQADPEIVRLACASDGCALGYCPEGPTRDELTSDRAFMKNVVLAKERSGSMWKLASPALQDDLDLLLLALKNGLHMRDVPVAIKNNLAFMERVLRVNARFYLELPQTLQAEFVLAREAVIAPDSTPQVHSKALALCPTLQSERRVVLSVCQRGDVELLPGLFNSPLSSCFRDDCEIMVAAVSRDHSLLAYASARLRACPELILVTISPTNAFDTLKELAPSVIRELPEIPTRAVEVCIAAELQYLPAHIPDEVWSSHRPLCHAWLVRGGRVLGAFESQLRVNLPYTQADIELPLAVVRYNWRETRKLGEPLLRDKDFILQALDLDGRVLRFAHSSLRQKPDIQVVAVANYDKNIPSGTTSSIQQCFGGCINIPDLARYTEDRLKVHHNFCQCFLPGIGIPRPHQPPQLRSKLRMLDCGVETSEAFKRLIAEYLGVPLGQELAMLRRASANLVHASTLSTTTNSLTASLRGRFEPEEDRLVADLRDPEIPDPRRFLAANRRIRIRGPNPLPVPVNHLRRERRMEYFRLRRARRGGAVGGDDNRDRMVNEALLLHGEDLDHLEDDFLFLDRDEVDFLMNPWDDDE